MGSTAQLTSLLSNRDLDRLARLRLGTARRFTNRSRGEHLAATGGASTEFCDYRDYSPGDDARFVDWNIFARTERPYLKQFHQEEELHVALVIDASNSMLFDGKFELGRQVAAALGVVALGGNERVSAFAAGAEAPAQHLPTRGRASMRKLFTFLEHVVPGGALPIEAGVEAFLRRHVGRGVAVLISDFLTAGDLRRAFNLLHSAGLEIFVVQVLSPGEIAPELTGDVRLFDSETAASLDVSAATDLLTLYHEYREAHTAHIAALCRQRQGKFLSLNSAQPTEQVLFEVMRRKGWLI